MLAVVPNRNLVSNIGFGNQASHTRDSLPTMAGLPPRAMRFALNHPPDVYLDRDVDNFSFPSDLFLDYRESKLLLEVASQSRRHGSATHS